RAGGGGGLSRQRLARRPPAAANLASVTLGGVRGGRRGYRVGSRVLGHARLASRGVPPLAAGARGPAEVAAAASPPPAGRSESSLGRLDDGAGVGGGAAPGSRSSLHARSVGRRVP